jgi:hypothetical protein
VQRSNGTKVTVLERLPFKIEFKETVRLMGRAEFLLL